MKRILAISLALLLALAVGATAREVERAVPMMYEEDPRAALPGGVFGVNQGPDTFYYGGTVWDAVDLRWEAGSPASAGWANRNMWSFAAGGFNGVPHSGENMDGWVGVDNTAQPPDYFDVKDDATLGATCVIAGNKSLFCGATNAECYDLCFVDNTGTGYDNDWKQAVHTPTYTFNSGDQITLGYDCAYESEAGQDFTYVILQVYDTMAGAFVNHDTLATHSGSGTVTESFDLDASLAGLEPVYFRIVFQFESDGGYSDRDGYSPTVCGAFALDTYSLDDNGTVYSEDFESTSVRSLPANWGHYSNACGDYAHSAWLANLPVSPSVDPCYGAPGGCALADSVLVLIDESTPAYPHPLCQDNYVMSPVIDFRDHPGLSGRILVYDAFRSLPLEDYVFTKWQVRYKPGCTSGGWSEWLRDDVIYFISEGTHCFHDIQDFSMYIPPEAEQVQVGLVVVNYCDEAPLGWACSNVCNATPYYDNLTFGVYGSDVAPCISQREQDYFQDQFAEDGSMNPLSTADTRIANYLSNLVPPIFGDTMVCRGSADNAEIWLVFRMAEVSPKQTYAHPFFTWFPGVNGGAWFEARMDTAEVTATGGLSTAPVPGNYATCFHEADPVRAANGLGEVVEILPNQVFQPGARIEYFLKACYAGSSDTLYLPADGPSAPEEFEILPMMVDDGAGSVEWPCLIYVDHFGRRGNDGISNSDRTARALFNAGYEFDMFNRLGPSSDLRNGIGRWAANAGQIGGPGTDKYNWGPGATIYQMLAYSQCILNTGNVYSYCIYQADADMLKSWLIVYTNIDHPRFLWVSGDSWARDLNRRAPWGPLFLNGTLATTYVANSYATSVSPWDYTYCLQINTTGGGAIVSATEPYKVRGNGCPRSLNCISSTGSGVREEIYDASATARYAAVSNAPGGMYYRTFTEGYDYCLMRDGSAGLPTCGVDPLASWFTSVLTWGGHTDNFCDWWNVDVQDPGVVPAVVTSLGQAFPNPMNPTATIKYTIGTPGKVQLRVFDVSGRVIRTLVDEAKTAGAYSVIWDGKNDGGERVASGVFFYQLNASGSELNKKIVILQ